MTPPPDLDRLTEAEKDALILALWARVQALTARVAELAARLNEPAKTPGNSSLPPSKSHKANRPGKEQRAGPRQGSLGRAGGGRPLAEEPDQRVIAKAAACAHCRAALGEDDQVLHARYDKVELPPIRPVVTRVEHYLGRCPCCGGTTLAPVPEGMEQGTPFGVSILALALYLRFTHAISYRRLTRLFLHLFALPVGEGARDALFRRAKPRFDNEAAAILARLRRGRVVCSDETMVRVDGRTCWNWVFQNEAVVIQVIRPSRSRAAPRAEGQHPAGVPPSPGAGTGSGSGAAAKPPPRSAAASALSRGARQPVRLPGASRRTAGQQRQRARSAADGGVPQGHRRLSVDLGAGPVRRGQVGGRHRRSAWHRRLPRHPCRPIRQDRSRLQLSSYAKS